jgi:glycosyltransferase involved in cell wall biosynthesis
MNKTVSIGVPIYNEDKFLRYTLDSLTSQSYPDIEIIICDNASTDNSEEIVKEYMQTHKNIRYHREKTNKGVAHNFINALELSDSKYFMWAGGHDVWSKNLIETAVKLFESHENASIVYSKTIWIDEDNNELAKESGWYDTRGMHPVERFFTVIWGNIHPILGLMRTEYLNNTRIINTPGGDLIVISSMALKGDILHSEEATCYRRELTQRRDESYEERIKRYQNDHFKVPVGLLNKLIPLMRLPTELFIIILTSKLRYLDKFYLLFLAFPTFFIKYLVARKK